MPRQQGPPSTSTLELLGSQDLWLLSDLSVTISACNSSVCSSDSVTVFFPFSRSTSLTPIYKKKIHFHFRMLFFGIQMCVGWYPQMHASGLYTYSGIPCRHWWHTSSLDKDERREWRPVITEGRNLPLMTVIGTLCLTSRILSPVSRNFSPRTRASKYSKC